MEANSPSTLEIPIVGMHCTGCAGRIESALRATAGVRSASVHFATGRAKIEYEADRLRPAAIAAIIEAEGFHAVLPTTANGSVTGPAPGSGAVATAIGVDSEEAARRSDLESLQRRFWLAAAISAPLIATTMAGHFFPEAAHRLHFPGRLWVEWTLATVVVFHCGRPFLAGAWKALRRKTADMNSLVAIGSLSAYGISAGSAIASGWNTGAHASHELPIYFEAAAGIVTLVLLGNLLLAKATARTRDAARSLLRLKPSTARLLSRFGSNAQPVEIAADDVGVGDLLIALPGDRFAVDGVIEEGTTTVDESMMTGESHPAAKQVGDGVAAGTVNLDGSVRYRAEKVGNETALARIAELVRHAQETKAPVQELADRIAAWFVPTMMATAAITFALWMHFGEPETRLRQGTVAAVSVLVIACPCALGLATPTAMMIGIARAAQAGILIKDASALQQASQIDAVFFDKTGTLTEGKPIVAEIEAAPGHDVETVLRIAAAVESHSNHPLAKAVLSAAAQRGVTWPESRNGRVTPGRGAMAQIDGKSATVGSSRWFMERAISTPAEWLTDEDDARSTALAALDRQCVGRLRFEDPLRPEAGAAVERLHSDGIETAMLTGDRRGIAERIAEQVGIRRVEAELVPEEKQSMVRDAVAAGKKPAFVGDGVNDAACLAAAELGVSLAGAADIAVEAADIVLMRPDLRKIPSTIDLARAVMRTVRVNLAFAFVYNAALVPLAAGAFYPWTGWLLNPMIASAAMAASSLSVVGNSLRLRYSALMEAGDSTP